MVNIWGEIINLYNAGHDAVLVTVIDKRGTGPSVVGRKMLVDRAGVALGSIGGGELESLVIKKARELMSKRRHSVETYNLSGEGLKDTDIKLNMICGGTVTLFFEYLSAPPTVCIIGMGHVGRSLADVMANLGWRIVPLEYIDRSAPHEAAKPVNFFKDMVENEAPPEGAFIVIAGYSHEEDYEVLKAVYQSKWKPAYIGLVASPHKSRLMVGKLIEELGSSINLGILRSPIGLNIGGNTPGEIAVSIAAELQCIRYGKEGNPLSLKWASDDKVAYK